MVNPASVKCEADDSVHSEDKTKRAHPEIEVLGTIKGNQEANDSQENPDYLLDFIELVEKYTT